MNHEDHIVNASINTIRFLAADAAEKAKSGHPGMPMGAAPAAYTLWTRHLRHNPANPLWPDRDRFVLSAGHASMLLYALLFLTGYDLALDDIKSFRQLGSKTPGHPERFHPPGTEMTTGPLGQGIGAAVGMAIAEAHLAAKFNQPGHEIIQHHTYVLASDGDLMEGVAYEACSLAGHLGLGKLIVLYDDNKVSLAGSTLLAFTEDITKRFEAFGWQVLEVADGNNVDEIDRAIGEAKGENGRPTLIRIHSCIGYGCPNKQGTCSVHGSPLGTEELRAAKKNLGWPEQEPFYIPDGVVDHCRSAVDRGKICEARWHETFARYAEAFADKAAEFWRTTAGELPDGWDSDFPSFGDDAAAVSTRKVSEAVLQRLASKIPELIGGSADLNPSCLTWLKALGDFQNPDAHGAMVEGAVGGEWGYGGRNIHFGVREHAMGAVAVGMAIHGGLRPYTGTFFIFTDYMRPPMRLCAMMGLPVVFVFTHDSIAVGEDGPTHQPIEQLMNLRAVPNLTVIRPADARETVEAWRTAVGNRKGPTVLVLTRQNLPVIDSGVCSPAANLKHGAYILWETGGMPEVILLATGSEVALTLEAAQRLAAEGKRVRVVSMPSWELFDAQPESYRDMVLPPGCKARLAVEAGIRLGWERYVGLEGATIGMDTFGASAPYHVLLERFGFTVAHITGVVRELLKEK
jgi:transketolase